jgi:hypothetical protein
MLELVTHETSSRIVECIPGIAVSGSTSAKIDQPRLARMPSRPKWRGYDLLAAAVTAADE